MRSNWLKLSSVCLMGIFLTGCWDSVEINERHVVLEMAIDKNPEVDHNRQDRIKKNYQVTYTIPDIGKLSGEDSLAEKVKMAMVTKSSTIATSLDEIEMKTQNTITFSHTKALILGEEILKDKQLFKAAMDGLMRDMQIGRGTSVLAVQGLAQQLVQVENPQNPILGLYIMKYFNNAERPTSYAKQQTIGNLTKELQNSGITTIPVAHIVSQQGKKGEEEGIEISGAAVIKNYELVGWLSKEEVRGKLFVEGKIKRVPIVVEYNGEYLTYNIETEQSKLKFQNTNGEWAANLDIRVKGNITEYISSFDKQIFSKEDIQNAAEILQREIDRQIKVAIDRSKEMNIDFLNIGLEMYRQHPKVWEEYKQNWEQTGYKSFTIHTNTKVTIQNTGILE